MTDRTVLVLAAGQSKRWLDAIWPADYPKQLLDIGGELLVQRVIRQVKARGLSPVLVTHDPRIMEAVPDTEIFSPRDRRWIMATVWSTRELWRGQVTCLYTDVLYSARLMDQMLSETRSPIFYGRQGDGFGFVFHARDPRWRDGVQAILADAEQQPAGEYCAGRNWELYRYLRGWDIRVHVPPNESNALYEFVPEEDYTRDLDTPPNWEAAQRDILNAGRLDDIPERIGT